MHERAEQEEEGRQEVMTGWRDILLGWGCGMLLGAVLGATTCMPPTVKAPIWRCTESEARRAGDHAVECLRTSPDPSDGQVSKCHENARELFCHPEFGL